VARAQVVRVADGAALVAQARHEAVLIGERGDGSSTPWRMITGSPCSRTPVWLARTSAASTGCVSSRVPACSERRAIRLEQRAGSPGYCACASAMHKRSHVVREPARERLLQQDRGIDRTVVDLLVGEQDPRGHVRERPHHDVDLAARPEAEHARERHVGRVVRDAVRRREHGVPALREAGREGVRRCQTVVESAQRRAAARRASSTTCASAAATKYGWIASGSKKPT
jgi:hypothetical protein